MKKSISTIAFLISSLRQAHAFTLSSTRSSRSNTLTSLSAIEVMSLDVLENHEEEGERMSKSIAGWLDLEWIPQEIHEQIGQSAKATYIRSRESGENEIMGIMTDVVDVLEKEWPKYNKDAFVNAWDIGNYVSDYLHTRVGVEDCGCHATIFNPDEE